MGLGIFELGLSIFSPLIGIGADGYIDTVDDLTLSGDLAIADTKAIQTGVVDDDYIVGKAVDNDTGVLTEIWRMTGASTPTFDIKAGRLTGTLTGNNQSIYDLNQVRCSTIRDTGGTTAFSFGVSGATLGVRLDANEQAIIDLGGGTADTTQPHLIARGTYDHGVDGGTIGTIGLGCTIPDNAIVIKAWLEVLTTCADGVDDTATIAITIPTDDANGIVTAVAINNGTPWDAGYHACIQDGAVGNFSEKCTAAREISMVIAVRDLSAGKFILWAEYIVSD